MSGGTYNYAYGPVYQFACDLDSHLRHPPDWEGEWQVYSKEHRRWLTPEESAPIIARAKELREWFVKHLELVSKAMHDIEWVDSSDYGPGDEVTALEALIDNLKEAPQRHT